MSRDLGSLEKRAQALVDPWIPEFGASAPTLTSKQGPMVYGEVFQVLWLTRFVVGLAKSVVRTSGLFLSIYG